MARSKKPMDIYEEEMLKLASQMSLAEGFDDIEWDPNNLDVTTDRVRHLEEIVEEHLISEEQILLDEDNRLSAEELTEIFSLNDLSDGLTPNSESLVNNNSTTPGTDDDAQTIVRPTELFLYATDCNNNTIVSDNAYDKNQTNSNSNSNHNSINNNHKRADLDFQSSPTRLRRRGSDRRREEKIKETFSTIGSKLKWLQNKIVQSIDSTVEVNEVHVL